MPPTVNVPITVSVSDLPEVLSLAFCARDVADHSVDPTLDSSGRLVEPTLDDIVKRDMRLVPASDLNRMKRSLAFLMPGTETDG